MSFGSIFQGLMKHIIISDSLLSLKVYLYNRIWRGSVLVQECQLAYSLKPYPIMWHCWLVTTLRLLRGRMKKTACFRRKGAKLWRLAIERQKKREPHVLWKNAMGEVFWCTEMWLYYIKYLHQYVLLTIPPDITAIINFKKRTHTMTTDNFILWHGNKSEWLGRDSTVHFLSLLKSGKISLSGDKSSHLALLIILQKALFILIIASYKNHQSKNE